MGITGKYDFKGIKSQGAKGIELLISASWAGFAGILKIPILGTIIDDCIQAFTNWLANNGLVVLNVTANAVDGTFDQQGFDTAMESALAAVGVDRTTLTDAQKKAIDGSVIAAFRKFAPM